MKTFDIELTLRIEATGPHATDNVLSWIRDRLDDTDILRIVVKEFPSGKRSAYPTDE